MAIPGFADFDNNKLGIGRDNSLSLVPPMSKLFIRSEYDIVRSFMNNGYVDVDISPVNYLCNAFATDFDAIRDVGLYGVTMLRSIFKQYDIALCSNNEERIKQLDKLLYEASDVQITNEEEMVIRDLYHGLDEMDFRLYRKLGMFCRLYFMFTASLWSTFGTTIYDIQTTMEIMDYTCKDNPNGENISLIGKLIDDYWLRVLVGLNCIF